MGVSDNDKKIPAVFYCTENGTEPVRDWIKEFSADDRKKIGITIATVEYGWPVGMPVCRAIKSHKGLWEVRCSISNGRTARVLFCIWDEKMVLLHGFVKKSQKTPARDLDLAKSRKKWIEE